MEKNVPKMLKRLNLTSQIVWMHSIHDQGAGIRSFMLMVTCYYGERIHTKVTPRDWDHRH